MLTDAQLRTTAVRLVAAHLVDLTHDQPDADRLLCAHHCDGADCDRAALNAGEEIRGVHHHIQAITARLGAVLDDYEQEEANDG